jgi:hypothetical protein
MSDICSFSTQVINFNQSSQCSGVTVTMPIDHFTGSGSATLDITTSNSPPSVASLASPLGLVSPSRVLAQSLLGLDLCIDLSSYSLPQQHMSIRSPTLLL